MQCGGFAKFVSVINSLYDITYHIIVLLQDE